MGWFGCGLQSGDTPLDVIGCMLDKNNPYDQSDDGDYWGDSDKWDKVHNGEFLREEDIIETLQEEAKSYRKNKEKWGYDCDNTGAQGILAVADWLLDHEFPIPESQLDLIKEVMEYEYRCPWAREDKGRQEAVDDFKARLLDYEPVEYHVIAKVTKTFGCKVKARSKLEALHVAENEFDIKQLDFENAEVNFS